MKFFVFLRSKLLYLLMSAACMGFTWALLSVLRQSAATIVSILILEALAVLLPVAVEYARKRSYYSRLLRSLDALDRKVLLCEVLDEPDFLEGRILYQTLMVCNKSMNDEIAFYRRQEEEYREYIEAWMHEVKTPLAAAKLTLENAPGAVPASVSEDLRRIEDDLEQALFYAWSNSVEKDYLIRPASLRELVNTAVRRNAKDMIASRIKLQLEPLDYTVLTDMKWVDFILNQILVNAIKYRSASPSIHIYAQQEKNSVALTIADNGIGIRAADLPRVFERGFTGETGRKFSKATGLGLYLSKRMCDKLGIGLSLASVEGEGTTIRLVFPSGTMHDLSKDT